MLYSWVLKFCEFCGFDGFMKFKLSKIYPNYGIFDSVGSHELFRLVIRENKIVNKLKMTHLWNLSTSKITNYMISNEFQPISVVIVIMFMT